MGATAAGQSNTRGALLAIGLNQFGPSLPGLKFSEVDANAIGKALGDHGFHNRVRTGDSVEFRTILRDIQELGAGLREAQTLVVYFSGYCQYDQSGKLMLGIPLRGAAAPETGLAFQEMAPSIASFATAFNRTRARIIFVVDGPLEVRKEINGAGAALVWVGPGTEYPGGHAVFAQSILDSLQQIDSASPIRWDQLVRRTNERLVEYGHGQSRLIGSWPGDNDMPPGNKGPFTRLVLIEKDSGFYSDELDRAFGGTAAIEFCDLEDDNPIPAEDRVRALKAILLPGASIVAIGRRVRDPGVNSRRISVSMFDKILQMFHQENTAIFLIGNLNGTAFKFDKPNAQMIVGDSLARSHLLQVLAQPGLTVRQVAEEVQKRVLEDPNHKRGDVPIFLAPAEPLFVVKPN
jgi:hypothetical protein